MSKNKSSVLNVGFNNFIPVSRLVAVVDTESNDASLLIKKSKTIDATLNRKAKSIVIMDNDQVVLSAVSVKTLLKRI